MTKLFQNAKRIFASLLVIALAFVVTLGVANAAPQTITVKRALTLEDLVTNYQYGFVIFTTTEGKTIYCVDPDKKGLTSGMTATFSKNGDAGLLYLLENGYPSKQITGNDEIDMYVTQAAVWWYMDETGQAGKFPDTFKNATSATDDYGLIPNYIKPMVAKAKAAKDTQVKPSITVSKEGTTLTLTSDGKYYESAFISATVTGTNTYNVDVKGATANTVVVDESGNIGTTMNSGEKFKIRVPAAEVSNNMNITVNFTAVGTIKVAKIYAPADQATYQRVAGLYTDEVSVNDNLTLSLTAKKRICEIDGDTYYGKNGTVVDKKTYNKECNKSCEFIDGKYYGKNGNEVDKRQYKIECEHVCEFTDGKYYGKNGKIVDKKTFNKECNHSCEYTDGKYYGKDGKVIDKKTFEKECEPTHVCEFTDDKFYGLDGKEVDKSTFDKECGQEVIVPSTGADVSSLAIILGVIMILSGASVIAYRNNKLF